MRIRPIREIETPLTTLECLFIRGKLLITVTYREQWKKDLGIEGADKNEEGDEKKEELDESEDQEVEDSKNKQVHTRIVVCQVEELDENEDQEVEDSKNKQVHTRRVACQVVELVAVLCNLEHQFLCVFFK